MLIFTNYICNIIFPKKAKDSLERSAILCFNMAAHILQCKAVSLCSSLDSSPLHCLALPLKMPIYPRLNAISSAITPHLLQKSSSLSLLFPFSLSFSPCTPFSHSLHLSLSTPLYVLIVPTSLRVTTSLYFSISLPTLLSPSSLCFFSGPWHRFLIGSLIGHSAWDKGLIKQ